MAIAVGVVVNVVVDVVTTIVVVVVATIVVVVVNLGGGCGGGIVVGDLGGGWRLLVGQGLRRKGGLLIEGLGREGKLFLLLPHEALFTQVTGLRTTPLALATHVDAAELLGVRGGNEACVVNAALESDAGCGACLTGVDDVGVVVTPLLLLLLLLWMMIVVKLLLVRSTIDVRTTL